MVQSHQEKRVDMELEEVLSSLRYKYNLFLEGRIQKTMNELLDVVTEIWIIKLRNRKYFFILKNPNTNFFYELKKGTELHSIN